MNVTKQGLEELKEICKKTTARECEHEECQAHKLCGKMMLHLVGRGKVFVKVPATWEDYYIDNLLKLEAKIKEVEEK